MKINLPPDIKIIILPLISLLILLLSGVFLLKLGLTKFSVQQKQIGDLEKEAKVLDQKNIILRDISPSIAQNASLFSFALPADDPTTMVISQLKILTASSGVLINSLSSRSNPKVSTIPEINIVVNVSGPIMSVFNFLNELANITPIVLVKSVALSQAENGDGTTADITLNSYWSAYPETIPATLEPLNDLLASEKDMISQMSTLRLPPFTELLPQDPSSSRSSPF